MLIGAGQKDAEPTDFSTACQSAEPGPAQLTMNIIYCLKKNSQ